MRRVRACVWHAGWRARSWALSRSSKFSFRFLVSKPLSENGEEPSQDAESSRFVHPRIARDHRVGVAHLSMRLRPIKRETEGALPPLERLLERLFAHDAEARRELVEPMDAALKRRLIHHEVIAPGDAVEGRSAKDLGAKESIERMRVVLVPRDLEGAFDVVERARIDVIRLRCAPDVGAFRRDRVTLAIDELRSRVHE